MLKEFTLRNKITEAEMDFHKRGRRDEYWNETLAWTLQDYHGSKGSVLDFTEDDWCVCKENDLTLREVLVLCGEEYLYHGSITDYLANCINEWRDNYGDQHAADSEVPKESMMGFVEDFYTWRRDCLPVVEKVYNNG